MYYRRAENMTQQCVKKRERTDTDEYLQSLPGDHTLT
jgi:hypothetical protein